MTPLRSFGSSIETGEKQLLRGVKTIIITVSAKRRKKHFEILLVVAKTESCSSPGQSPTGWQLDDQLFLIVLK